MKNLKIVILFSLCLIGCTEESAYEMLHPIQHVEVGPVTLECERYVGIEICSSVRQKVCEDRKEFFK